jgi:hypothetical protein
VASATGNIAVALTIAAAGVFFGLITATALGRVTSANRLGLLVGCVALATAAAAVAVWRVFGYSAIWRSPASNGSVGNTAVLSSQPGYPSGATSSELPFNSLS